MLCKLCETANRLGETRTRNHMPFAISGVVERNRAQGKKESWDLGVEIARMDI